MDTLPQGYRIILERLIGLLFLVAQHANANKMTSNNLAIVFGPALMRRKVENVKQVVQVRSSLYPFVIRRTAFFFFFFDIRNECTGLSRDNSNRSSSD